jgi:excisionase family DNA binding protein
MRRKKMEDKFYNLKQVSELLITPIPYLRKLIKEEKLKGHYIGRQYIISEKELKEFINTLGVKQI